MSELEVPGQGLACQQPPFHCALTRLSMPHAQRRRERAQSMESLLMWTLTRHECPPS